MTAGANPRTVIYAGAYEAEYTANALTASRTYLAEGVLHNGAGTQMGLSFMHQDRLGSALVITDKGGAILTSDGAQAEFRSFDAFGKARDNKGWDSFGGQLFANNPNGKRNRKGFTGHEHLDEAGLIHMNGRAYDYNLGRFYGVDPVIQFPTNSQSLNGYSYLMNNPLSGTDPTGYCQAMTGTRICSSASRLADKVSSTLAKGGSVVFSGATAEQASRIRAWADKNGYSTNMGTSQKSQVDGAKGGASGVGGTSRSAALIAGTGAGLNKTAEASAQAPAYYVADSASRTRREALNGKIKLSDSNDELKMALAILLSNEKSLTMIEKAVDRWGILSIKGSEGAGFDSVTSDKDGGIIIDLNQSKIAFEFKFTGGSKEANAIIDGKMPGFYPSPDSSSGHPFYTPFSLIRTLAHELAHSAYSDFSSIIDDEPDTIRRENEVMKSIDPRMVERVLCHSCWKSVQDLEN